MHRSHQGRAQALEHALASPRGRQSTTPANGIRIADPQLGGAAVPPRVARELGIAPVRKKPVLAEDLKQVLGQIPDSVSLLGRRDRALLLFGFNGAFRRPELVGLDVKDREETRDGLVATLCRSKTDPEGGKEDRRAAGRRAGQLPAVGARSMAGCGADQLGSAVSPRHAARPGA